MWLCEWPNMSSVASAQVVGILQLLHFPGFVLIVYIFQQSPGGLYNHRSMAYLRALGGEWYWLLPPATTMNKKQPYRAKNVPHLAASPAGSTQLGRGHARQKYVLLGHFPLQQCKARKAGKGRPIPDRGSDWHLLASLAVARSQQGAKPFTRVIWRHCNKWPPQGGLPSSVLRCWKQCFPPPRRKHDDVTPITSGVGDGWLGDLPWVGKHPGLLLLQVLVKKKQAPAESYLAQDLISWMKSSMAKNMPVLLHSSYSFIGVRQEIPSHWILPSYVRHQLIWYERPANLRLYIPILACNLW